MSTTQLEDKLNEVSAKLHLLLSACGNFEEKCPASLSAYYLIRDCLDTLAAVRENLQNGEHV